MGLLRARKSVRKRVERTVDGGRIRALLASPAMHIRGSGQPSVFEVVHGHREPFQQGGEQAALLRAQLADQPALVGSMFRKDPLHETFRAEVRTTSPGARRPPTAILRSPGGNAHLPERTNGHGGHPVTEGQWGGTRV